MEALVTWISFFSVWCWSVIGWSTTKKDRERSFFFGVSAGLVLFFVFAEVLTAIQQAR